MAAYTYDPGKINENGVDRMRFELGDTIVDMGELTSPLCDEEYEAVLSANKDWRKAKIACLKAIVMKLSYEVDMSVTGLAYSLSQRFDRWKDMFDEEEKKLKDSRAVPFVNCGAVSGEPYFHMGLHDNQIGKY